MTMIEEPRKIVLRRPSILPIKMQSMAPQKQPTLYEAMEIPWIVDRWFAWLEERPWMQSLRVQISGKTSVKAGKVKRPPMTPLRVVLAGDHVFEQVGNRTDHNQRACNLLVLSVSLPRTSLTGNQDLLAHQQQHLGACLEGQSSSLIPFFQTYWAVDKERYGRLGIKS